MSFTVTIDGPAAAGKGTISRAVAAHFDFAHLDTGLLYRAIAWKSLSGQDPIEAAAGLRPDDLADESLLRTREVATEASKVAVIPEVRSNLTDFQRAFAQRAGGAVLDGRDIGTVICPDAPAKLFVTASPEVRAKRRWIELSDRGEVAAFETVLNDVKTRDERDRSRATSPLIAAEDAVEIDTSELTIEQAVAAAILAVTQKRDG